MIDFFNKIIEALDEGEIPYMLSGERSHELILGAQGHKGF